MNPQGGDLDRLLRRLAGRRVLARAILLFERIWPALWPAAGVAGLFVCVALLDLPRMLPPWAHITLLAVTLLVIAGLLVRNLRTIRAPDDKAADRRLEIASGLTHRPLSVLTDRPSRGNAGPDTAAVALWQAHLIRAARQVSRLRIGAPRPGLARRDPRALRAALLVALVAAFGIAGEDAPSRLAQAMEPTLPRPPSPLATELQAWITPPAYTRLAPIFLKRDNATLSVPEGSRLTVSVTGGETTPALALNGKTEQFRLLDKTSFQADRTLTEGGHLTIRRSGAELASWDVAVVADQPPVVDWSEPPGRAQGSQQTRLPWRVSDDYGVISLQAELRLRDRADASPLVVTIPLPGGAPKSAQGVHQQDLTAHPWAGLPVTVKLVGRDASSHTGESKIAEFVLPERHFENPVARALIAIRRGLSLHPNDRDSAVDGLDPLLMAPEALRGDLGAYTNLSAIYYLLEFDKSPSAIDQAQQQMWELALHLEEGRTEQTARALDQARQAARDALDKAVHEPNQQNLQDLDKRLHELEQAIEQHLQALAEDARRNNAEMPFDPDAQHLSNRDLDKMAEQAREAARQGRMQDAQQRMAELERMLDRLRNAQTQRGREGENPESAQRQRGRQQMGAVQDIIGRQGKVLDHTQGRADDTNRVPFGATPGAPQPTADQGAQREADQRVQQALRRALGELMQQFGDLTGKVPPSLGEADTAMREAGRQLGQGDDAGAGVSQQKAIEALQKGGREMGQAMARQFGPQGGADSGDQEGDSDGPMGLSLHDGQGDDQGRGWRPGPPPGRADSGRDPFGRRLGQGSSGADESGDVTVPEERERQHTRAIEEELRRRDAERTRPQPELDYIDRLLKQF